ncbi:hypothetical protein V1477_014367 [Vespula maculifrons]|uniref:Uncharacterized protein n=1 Tax=Vespula maculifrons TaxID=7453 RepID=A0ABD2BKU7_VESMC
MGSSASGRPRDVTRTLVTPCRANGGTAALLCLDSNRYINNMRIRSHRGKTIVIVVLVMVIIIIIIIIVVVVVVAVVVVIVVVVVVVNGDGGGGGSCDCSGEIGEAARACPVVSTSRVGGGGGGGELRRLCRPGPLPRNTRPAEPRHYVAHRRPRLTFAPTSLKLRSVVGTHPDPNCLSESSI